MPNGVDLGLVAVLLLSAVFVAWYFAGSAFNRRRARALANEMKDALLALGGTSKVRWFGLTAFQMTTEGAQPPFRDLSVLVTLRPREMPINWALGIAARRTDLATVEASVRSPLPFEFELLDPKSAVGRRRVRARTKWSSLSLSGREWLLWSEDEDEAHAVLEALDGGTGLPGVLAVKASPGDPPRVAAAVSFDPGSATARIDFVRRLAARVGGQ